MLCRCGADSQEPLRICVCACPNGCSARVYLSYYLVDVLLGNLVYLCVFHCRILLYGAKRVYIYISVVGSPFLWSFCFRTAFFLQFFL